VRRRLFPPMAKPKSEVDLAEVVREFSGSETRWRRGWDSNPRTTFAVAGFQDRCLQPLGHPSVLARRNIYNVSGGGLVRKVPLSGRHRQNGSNRSRRLTLDIHVRTKPTP
jgi:hypothetical protein